MAVCWAAALALLGVSPGPVAAQQESDLTRARSTFQQAVELEQAGNCPAALPLFRQVGQVRMTPQVRFHIALCEAQLGRLVAALGGYELALTDADTVGPGFRDEVEQNIQRLRQRVPRLKIQRGSGAEAATIELDGVALGSSSIGVEVPLDPGPHAVTAHARGYETFEQTVTLAEGATQTLEVTLVPVPEPQQSVAPIAPTRLDSGIRTPELIPYVIGGVGVASLVSSGVLFALRQGALGNLEDACDGNLCNESERDEYDRLQTYHYGALVTLGVGVAAVGTAATLIILERRPKHEQQQARLTVVPRLLPHEAGATVRLKF
jgi:hypothetical protein